MIKRLARLALHAFPAVCLGLLVATASAQQGSTIRGKITTSAGQPVPRVVVFLETGTGAPINQTVTNNEGDYAFSGLEGTTFIVSVNETDYQPVRERVQFLTEAGAEQPGTTQFLNLTLTPKAGERTGAGGTLFAQHVPDNAREAFDRGMKLSRENKSEDAIAAWREATTIFPDYFDAHFALGNELLKAKKLNECIEELERARAINPKEPRVFASFGLTLMTARKYSVAAAAFGEAARLNPNEPQYPALRAEALIDQAASIDPANGDAKMRSQLLDLAKVDLDRCEKLGGAKLPSLFMQRARLYERMGDKPKAADALEAYLKAFPSAPNAPAIRDSIAKLRSR